MSGKRYAIYLGYMDPLALTKHGRLALHRRRHPKRGKSRPRPTERYLRHPAQIYGQKPRLGKGEVALTSSYLLRYPAEYGLPRDGQLPPGVTTDINAALNVVESTFDRHEDEDSDRDERGAVPQTTFQMDLRPYGEDLSEPLLCLQVVAFPRHRVASRMVAVLLARGYTLHRER